MAKTITTKGGTVYVVSGKTAYPARDPDRSRRHGYNPRLDWGPDAAAACGLLVDGTLSRGDYRVSNAGPEWREVYEALQTV